MRAVVLVAPVESLGSKVAKALAAGSKARMVGHRVVKAWKVHVAVAPMARRGVASSVPPAPASTARGTEARRRGTATAIEMMMTATANPKEGRPRPSYFR